LRLYTHNVPEASKEHLYIITTKIQQHFYSIIFRCSHFTLLTDVSILVKFREALENKFNTILKFCQEVNCHQGVKDVLACFEPEASDKATCILLLLMAYFKEPKDAIVLDVDVSIFSL
jgi:hypothetical protein